MYDEQKANRVVKFIKGLKHSKGKWAGQPFDLMPWQEKIVRDLFGTVNKDGNRQYREAYIEIPKKNGKTETGAAIALYLLFGDGEKGAEIYSAAAEREQAALVYNAASPMVRRSKALTKRSKVLDSQKRIVYYGTDSFYRVLSADAKTKEGFNTHGAIIDELHVQPNRDLVDTLTTGTAAREQPLIIYITTAGYDRNSICWEKHTYAEKIIKGIIKDPTFYAVIYAADEGDDWEDEKVWFKANPALGVFRSLEQLRSEYKKAKEIPALQNTFKRYYLNIWTSQETRWIDIKKWNATAGMVIEDNLKGKDCYAGLDLASTSDIAALELVFPIGKMYKVLSFFFIPKDNMVQRIKKDGVHYDVWEKEGFIFATEGNVIDYQFIEDFISECAKKFRIRQLAYDPWNATATAQRLQEKGMETVEVSQTIKNLNAPTKFLETLILSERIHHNANPVLKWMIDNVMIKTDHAGNIKPDKKKSTEKIDGVIALIMALNGAMLAGKSTSVYDRRGVRII